MRRFRSQRTVLTLTLLILVLASVAPANARADQPSVHPYAVLRKPADLHSSSRTSMQAYRHPAATTPKLRPTYAYGWFGVKAQPRAERQYGYNNLHTRWIWK